MEENYWTVRWFHLGVFSMSQIPGQESGRRNCLTQQNIAWILKPTEWVLVCGTCISWLEVTGHVVSLHSHLIVCKESCSFPPHPLCKKQSCLTCKKVKSELQTWFSFSDSPEPARLQCQKGSFSYLLPSPYLSLSFSTADAVSWFYTLPNSTRIY